MKKKSIQKTKLDLLAEAILRSDTDLAQEILLLILPAEQLVIPGLNSRTDRTYQIKLESVLRETARQKGITDKIFLSALGRHKDYFTIVRALTSAYPIISLKSLRTEPFLHITPSKPKRYFSTEEVWREKRGGEWLIEPKHDGWECQIHIADNQVRVYSQAGNTINEYVPNIEKTSLEFWGNRKVILEGELVAINPRTNQPLPHTYVCKENSQHRIYPFDLMYLDRDITESSCIMRRRLLEELFKGKSSQDLCLIEQIYASDWETFDSTIQNWISQGFEGAIAKRPWVEYEANMRTSNRVKIKIKDYIDAVVLGYKIEVGSFLAALIDKSGELKPFAWVPIIEDMKHSLEALRDTEIPAITMGDRTTDIQVKPEMVVEIQGDHIYQLANSECKDLSGVGWSLFSPTVKRIREDKAAIDATTVDEFLRLPVVSGHTKPSTNEEELD